MLEPKYKIGDKVIITLDDELNKGEHVGTIEIIDRYPKCITYDVLISDHRHPSSPNIISECLCKHYKESEIKPYNNE